MRKVNATGIAVAAGILILWAGVRVATFSGFAASDDSNYAEMASRVSRGEFPPSGTGMPSEYPQRLGITLPVALLFRLVGISEVTALILPVVASLATLLLAFAAGTVFFSLRAGLLAAALYAVMPIDARFATMLLSDTPASFWAAAGCLLLYRGWVAARPGRKALLGSAAALCYSASWITRTQVAHLAPFVLAVLLVACARDRKNLWLAGSVAVVSVAALAGECTLYLVTRGDFLYTFHQTEVHYLEDPKWFFIEGGAFGWPPGQYVWGLLRRWLRQGPSALFFNANFAWALLVAAFAVLYALRFRLKQFAYPMAWFLFAALMFNFGSASLRHYQPLPWIDSLMLLALFPAVLVTAGWLDYMFSGAGSVNAGASAERRFWAWCACGVLVIAACMGIVQHVRQGIGCPVARQVARIATPEEILYCDPANVRALRFFRGYPEAESIADYSGMSEASIPSGARVLVDSYQLIRLRDNINYMPPTWTQSPPKGWQPIWTWREATLYRVP